MISTEQRAFFAENGFLVIERLLSPDELATLRDRTEAIASGRRRNRCHSLSACSPPPTWRISRRFFPPAACATNWKQGSSESWLRQAIYMEGWKQSSLACS